MSFIARKSTEVSTAGQVAAVVADFRELGVRATPFGDREEVALLYVTAQLDSRKQPIVITQNLARSLDERSNLFAAINGILDGKMPDDGLDPAALIGHQVLLTVEVVTTSAGTPFAKVVSVSAAPEGQHVRIPATFRRTLRPTGRRSA